MSVLVARDPSTAGHIVFPWPDPVPWGAELVCSEKEVAVICPNWEVGEQFGPGRHAITPPNPQSHILAYFITTVPQTVVFDRLIAVMDGSTGQPVGVRFFGTAQIRIGDPLLLCHQLVGLPYHDLTTGIIRSAELSISRALQRGIVNISMAHGTVRALANADALAQLVNMAASANPLNIAVTGLEFVRFDELNLSIHGGEAIRWKGASGELPAQQAASMPGNDSMDSDLDAETQSASQSSASLMAGASQHSGSHPPAPVSSQSGSHGVIGGGQQSGSRPSIPVIQPSGSHPSIPTIQRSGSHPSIPAIQQPGQPGPQPGPGGPPAGRQSNPSMPPGSPAPVRRKTPALGMPMVSTATGEVPLPSGSKVLVYWNDGLWHTAIVRHFEGGRYQIAIDGGDTLAWVQANQIRPA